MRRVLPYVLSVLCLFHPLVARAQVGGGQITGIVTDTAGAPVSGATIIAIQLSTGVTRTVVSSAAGVYAVPGLIPGEYGLDIDLPGFKPIRRRGVQVETGEAVRLDVALDV